MKVKTKRRICGWISGTSFFLALGIGGNIECGFTSLGEGAPLMFLFIGIFALAAYKGGYMR